MHERLFYRPWRAENVRDKLQRQLSILPHREWLYGEQTYNGHKRGIIGRHRSVRKNAAWPL